MREYIFKYLSQNYKLLLSVYGDDSIVTLIGERVRPNIMLDEIALIFGLSDRETKNIIDDWAVFQNPYNLKGKYSVIVNLEKYWEGLTDSSFDGIAFPMVRQVAAQTVALDIVPVQPLKMPKMELVYLDYVYGEKWYKKFYKKVIAYIKKIKYLCNKIKIWG